MSSVPRPQEFDLKNQSYIYREISTQRSSEESCTTNYYQVRHPRLQELAALEFLNMNLAVEAFSYLRSERQLGYIVKSRVFEGYLSTTGLVLIVQGSRVDPIEMDKEIEGFLRLFHAQLLNITDEEFIKMKDSLTESLSQKDDSLSERGERYFAAIKKKTYEFKKKEKIQQYMESLQKSDVINLFERIFINERSKLSIQIFRSSNSTALELGNQEDRVFVNYEELKGALAYI